MAAPKLRKLSRNPQVWFNSGVTQKASHCRQKEERSFLPMIWSHSRERQYHSPALQRGGASPRAHPGQKAKPGLQDAEEKQDSFPKDEGVALHGTRTKSQTQNQDLVAHLHAPALPPPSHSLGSVCPPRRWGVSPLLYPHNCWSHEWVNDRGVP